MPAHVDKACQDAIAIVAAALHLLIWALHYVVGGSASSSTIIYYSIYIYIYIYIFVCLFIYITIGYDQRCRRILRGSSIIVEDLDDAEA